MLNQMLEKQPFSNSADRVQFLGVDSIDVRTLFRSADGTGRTSLDKAGKVQCITSHLWSDSFLARSIPDKSYLRFPKNM